ncbi:MAG TPA: putative nucleotide-diphospho-sugar transferase [Acetobacteraceae bacterium]|nr:putative nucleotide-diphospho-sugar transferase [Acetobacteraceae bacterium]
MSQSAPYAGAIQPALRAAAALAATTARPPIIVCADSGFGRILDNWLRHLEAAAAGPALVLALDDALEARLAGQGVPLAPFRHDGTTQDLWVRRAQLFASLAAAGVSFIHSDADAVWHRDVQGGLLAGGHDLVFSQGTFLPAAAVERWGFVLCCGLFAVRAGPASAAALRAVAEHAVTLRDDQVAMNLVLAGAGVSWRREGLRRQSIRMAGGVFDVFDRSLEGHCATWSLRVSLLPQAMVTRLPVPPRPETAVSHPLTPSDAAAKEAELRRLGCWREG